MRFPQTWSLISLEAYFDDGLRHQHCFANFSARGSGEGGRGKGYKLKTTVRHGIISEDMIIAGQSDMQI